MVSVVTAVLGEITSGKSVGEQLAEQPVLVRGAWARWEAGGALSWQRARWGVGTWELGIPREKPCVVGGIS